MRDTHPPMLIEVALVHYWSSDPVEEMRRRGAVPGMVEHFRDELRAAGLLGADGKPTEGLRLWVQALGRVPFPVQKWVIEPEATLADQQRQATDLRARIEHDFMRGRTDGSAP